MGKLKNTGMIAGAGALGYLGLSTAENAGNQTAQAIKSVVDNIGNETLNILEKTGVYIGDFAPLSALGINDLIEKLGTSTSLGELGIAGVAGLGVGYVGGKITEKFGKITGHESETDNTVAKAGYGITAASSVVGAGVLAGTTAAATTSYILGKKLSQFVLSEKYAHYLGLASAAGGAFVGWGADQGTVIGAMLVAGAGTMIWEAGTLSREKNRKKRADKRAANKAKKRA